MVAVVATANSFIATTRPQVVESSHESVDFESGSRRLRRHLSLQVLKVGPQVSGRVQRRLYLFGLFRVHAHQIVAFVHLLFVVIVEFPALEFLA